MNGLTPKNLIPKWMRPDEAREELARNLDTVLPQWSEAGAVGSETPPTLQTPIGGPPHLNLPFEPQLAASGELNAAAIMEQATAVVRKFETEHLAAQTKIDELSTAVIKAAADQKQDRQKIGFLELENLQLRNDIQNLSATNEGYRQFFERILEKCDEFDIQRRPKPARAKRERKPKQETVQCDESTSSETSSETSLQALLPLSVPSPT